MLPFLHQLCLWLPWHKFVVRKRLSVQCEYLRCSCGREFAMNHDVRVILPWEDISYHYASMPDPASER